ncbi:MAG: hypothetical protein A3E88_06845 [Legionellales bacterium RIFCSPHIGHO2_12_FULL_35_11]|nr:MAG: hypothetical protein A3E88_06845 [Legionellales bacterium RIFCSPHIGHO2_12_FULL_35_11]
MQKPRKKYNNFINLTNGFSLIELLIVILILSIISLFAYPSYKFQVIKLRRNDAKTSLYDLANRLENYYLLNNSYEKATIATNTINDVLKSDISMGGWYKLSIIQTSKHDFKLQAEAIKNQAIDDSSCKYYYISRNGELNYPKNC